MSNFTREQIDTAVALAKRNRQSKSGKTGFEVAERYLRRYSQCVFGVEQITCDCAGTTLSYLNLGDAYDYTVCRYGGKYFGGSWGDWLEEQECEYDDENNTVGCGWCGKRTPCAEQWSESICEKCGHNVSGG
jgi:hypothetical protein